MKLSSFWQLRWKLIDKCHLLIAVIVNFNKTQMWFDKVLWRALLSSLLTVFFFLIFMQFFFVCLWNLIFFLFQINCETFFFFSFIYSICVLRSWTDTRFNTPTTCTTVRSTCVGGTFASVTSRCTPGEVSVIIFNFEFNWFSFWPLLHSDPSVHHHHRQTFGRCKHEFRHTFGIHRWRRYGSWALI